MFDKQILKEKILISNEIAASEFKNWKMHLDSANFQTVSTSDFEQYTDLALENGAVYIAEISHAGRRIRIYALPEEKRTELNGIKYIEISEPKPVKKLKDNKWEYVSFVVDRYEDFLKDDQKGRKVLEKVRVIGEDRFCYYIDKKSKTIVQFRNRSVANSKEAQEDEVQKNGVDELVKEKALRMSLMADFENYRRTTQKRIEEVMNNASQKMAAKLFDIVDDFDRAIKERHLDEGVKSIYDKLQSALREEGYEAIETKPGDSFDAHTMQALSSVPTASEAEDNKVREVFQKGYKNVQTGQIVRTAKVIVSKYLPK